MPVQCGKYGKGLPEQLANSLIVAARRLCMSPQSVYICRVHVQPLILTIVLVELVLNTFTQSVS